MENFSKQIAVCVFVDGIKIFAIKASLQESLLNIREKLEDKLINKSININNLDFVFDDTVVERNSENEFSLNDVIIDNKNLYLTTNKNEPPPPEIIETIQPTKSKKNKEDLQIIQENRASKYLIEIKKPIEGSRFIKKIGNLDIYKYPLKDFSRDDEARAISMLVIGETGIGKTTLINAFLNAFLGVQINDPFRYQIIAENFTNKTEVVTVYNIQPVNSYPPIKIIDTPGFGNTKGIKNDKKVKDKIYDLFKYKLDSINLICFVIQSSNARLTTKQKYIFSSIFDLFGKDLTEHFVAMLTFCDGNIPQVIQALEDKDSIFSNVIKSMKGKNWFYKFNNSAIFNGSVNDEFTKMFWKLEMNSFKDFIQHLLNTPTKSLTQSKQVLQQRENLETSVAKLQKYLTNGLTQIEAIRSVLNKIENAKLNMNASSHFNIKTTIQQCEQKPITGHFTLLCTKCNFTCNVNCHCGPGKSKKNCEPMKNGYCLVCPGKCHYSEHGSFPFVYVYKNVEKVVTDEDLKRKYLDSSSQYEQQAQVFEGLKKDFSSLLDECMNIQEEIKNGVDRLREIALNDNSYQSSEDYIDLLINSEESEKKSGYMGRINGLREMKEKYKLLREAYNKENTTLKTLEKFKNKYNSDHYTTVVSNNFTEYSDSKRECLIF